MFKKLLIITLLFFTSCSTYGIIKVTHDDFKEQKIIELRFAYSSDEGNLEEIYRSEFKFTKEINAQNKEKFT